MLCDLPQLKFLSFAYIVFVISDNDDDNALILRCIFVRTIYFVTCSPSSSADAD